MEIKITLPNFDYEFENYWFYRRGGFTIDKRTTTAKMLIEDVKKMNFKKSKQTGYEYNLHPALVYTSLKTRENLFTFENLN